MSGVMKAGGAFVPRSPFHPSEHLRTIVQDVRARLALADTDAAGLFDAAVDRVFVVPATDMSATGIADDFLVVVWSKKKLYTSGGTGTPNGVVMELGALSANMKHLGAAFGFSKGSRVFQSSSYTFGVAILDIFATLAAGGYVCNPSEDPRANM